ncbi:MAG: hypothetical protein KGL39_55180 [Patescibacteria group bacterium]|nr:hypothetical protein [Patescibacteria group bacterium]
MAAIVGNVQMYFGEDLPLLDKVYEADGVTPQNVSGWSAQLTIHAPDDPGTVYVTKSTGAGTLTPANPSPPTVGYNWAFSCAITHADLVGIQLVPGQLAYRYTRTDSGNNTVVTVGLFSVLP